MGENKSNLIARWTGQMLGGMLIFGTILFLAAGRINWVEGWVYLGVNLVIQLLSAVILIPRQPGMLADRSQAQKGTKSWDRFFAPVVAFVGPLAILIVAGLDARFAWSPKIQIIFWITGCILAIACQLFVLWAMASNPFFATTVRIQSERGHIVVCRGPYRVVRHPGYLGAILFGVFCPVVLGSWWAFIPSLLTNVFIILRTRLEDQTLQTELPGYQEYSSNVRYRLFPGLW